MTQVEPSGTMIVFSATPGELTEGERRQSDNIAPQDYFRNRERAERSAAKKATSNAARSIHQQLAQEYAVLARKPGR